jgi:large conductance mechanosensitive channel
MLKDFKDFVMKGNVMDLAVGVIIGGAFGKIVDSLVKDVITPVVGLFGGQPDFSSIIIGGKAVMKDGKQIIEGGIMVGSFINAIISFLILAAVIFFIFVKPMAKLKALTDKPAAPAAPPEPAADVKLLTEIRDLLKAK